VNSSNPENKTASSQIREDLPSHSTRHRAKKIRTTCLSCALILLLPIVIIFVIFALPSPQPTGSFKSGGLGLTRAEWEQKFKPYPRYFGDYLKPYISYDGPDDVTYDVFYWPEGWLAKDQARIDGIEIFELVHDTDEAHVIAGRYFPADAQLLWTGSDPQRPEGFFFVYHSRSLENRYPRRLTTDDPWNGAAPGTFYVIGWDLGMTVKIPSGGWGSTDSPLLAQSTPTPP
jgi:hypothetical protein